VFCSVAAAAAQGGRENGEIAALGARLAGRPGGEDRPARRGWGPRHGRSFAALLRERGLGPVSVPAAADCTRLLGAAGTGLARARLRRGEQLTGAGVVTCLAHGRVTGRRASEQMRALRRHAGTAPAPAGRPG